mgnify:CR=1 FL=1
MSYIEASERRESAKRPDFLRETLVEQYGVKRAEIIFQFTNPNPFALSRLLLVKGSENQPGGVVLGKTGENFALWQMLASYPVEINQTVKRAEGIVVFWDDRAAGGLGPYLESLTQAIGPGKGIWVLEKAVLDSSSREARLATLESWGLKNRKVVQIGKSGINLWYGQTAKDRLRRTIDLTAKPWYRSVRAEMIRSYLAEGWREVDCRQLDEACRQSRFPLGDISNLRLGFGVKLRAPCGCRWLVDLHGEWERTESCIDPDCDGSPKITIERKTPKELKRQNFFYVGDNIPSSFTCHHQDRKTGYCGARLVFDRRIVNESERRGWVKVISDLKCPHHGLLGRRPKIYRVKKGQIRHYPESKK